MRRFNLNWQLGYEEGLKVGIENENNRIIKLLEEHLGYGDSEWDSNVMAVIKVIKGEQK